MPRSPREGAVSRLTASVDAGRWLLGVGAGSGTVARAAARGGADLVVVYSSGRFRRAGLSSLSALLPFANANEIVFDLVPEVVRAAGDVPVLAGICGTDPFADLDGIASRLRAMGVCGVQNFPTIGMFGHEFRADLEATGISFEQEVELMRAAQRAGLLSCAYVTTEEDARRMAVAGVDIVAPLLGVTRATVTPDALTAAANEVRCMTTAATEVRDGLVLLFHGGPAASADDVAGIRERVPELHGFLAASAVERGPVARAVEEATRAFASAAGPSDPGPDFSSPPPLLPIELTTDSLARYLVERGIVDGDDEVEIEELGGGLSNVVLAWSSGAASGVVKQSRPRLRVADEWLADVRRVINEREAIGALAGRLRAGRVPTISFVDDSAFAFGMERIPSGSVLWKDDLMSGRLDVARAEQAGRLMREIHDITRDDPSIAARFAAMPLLDQNRLEPWYRASAVHHPDLAPAIEYAIRRLLDVKSVLVHGDFVPKNILLVDGDIVIVDFEVAHFGNPGYDVATFINHMLLKGFRFAERRAGFLELAERMWRVYRASGEPDDNAFVENEAVLQLGALMLARLDGKSKVEYLVGHVGADDARAFGRWVLRRRPASLARVFEQYQRQ